MAPDKKNLKLAIYTCMLPVNVWSLKLLVTSHMLEFIDSLIKRKIHLPTTHTRARTRAPYISPWTSCQSLQLDIVDRV